MVTLRSHEWPHAFGHSERIYTRPELVDWINTCPKEAASELGVSVSTVRRLWEAKLLRAFMPAPVYGAGAYYMHPSFEALLSTFNTAGNRPYNPLAQINPSGASGFSSVGPTLDGFPIRWVDAMRLRAPARHKAERHFAATIKTFARYATSAR